MVCGLAARAGAQPADNTAMTTTATKRYTVMTISPVRVVDQRAARRTGTASRVTGQEAQTVGSHPQLHARILKRVEELCRATQCLRAAAPGNDMTSAKEWQL
jgi:hypothetical protein